MGGSLWPGTEIGLQIPTGSFLGWPHNAETSRAELYLRRSSTKVGGGNLDRSGPWPTLSVRFFPFSETTPYISGVFAVWVAFCVHNVVRAHYHREGQET